MRLILLALTFVILMTVSSYAYVVDGFVLNDWGINLYDNPAGTSGDANRAGYLDSHKPTGATVDVVTEDNTDRFAETVNVGPGNSIGNVFDAEAMYFDNDSSNAYLAVITGLSRWGSNAGGALYRPGDIGIDLDMDGLYEYGIDISTYNSTTKLARLYSGLSEDNWRETDIYHVDGTENVDPYSIQNTNGLSYKLVSFVYSKRQNSHYVLEAGIPLDYLGFENYSEQNLGLHWTMQCGNDYLNLKASVNPTPEPASVSLLGLGLLGLFGLKRKK